MPGGKVAVYTGILPYTQGETGLAAVVGHEIAHALAENGNEGMNQALLLVLMARAGYDPRESIPFWERMSKASKAKVPEFLSTHPAPESRIENIKNYLPEALPYYQKRR